MHQIQILSPQLINRIKAGEVIERPAAAVKELVENAVDAGADNVEIYIEKAGRNFITVTDNGSGILPDDLKLAVHSHATSKLTEDNLFKIGTLGFRGEALASIGAVSKLTITSKHHTSKDTWQITVQGGERHEIRPVSSIITGTKIEIQDLFYATPVRLKFLRSEATEQQEIIKIIEKLAMSHPDIAFSLKTENRILKQFPASSMSERVMMVMGKAFHDNSTTLQFVQGAIKIYGYVSLPTFNQRSANDIHFFINNRPVKDKLMNIAIKIAYMDLMPRDKFPSAVVFLELPFEDVDVNVHPTKAEVRFKEIDVIRNSLIGAIKSSLQNISYQTSSNNSTNLLKKFYPMPPQSLSQKPSMKDLQNLPNIFPETLNHMSFNTSASVQPQLQMQEKYNKSIIFKKDTASMPLSSSASAYMTSIQKNTNDTTTHTPVDQTISSNVSSDDSAINNSKNQNNFGHFLGFAKCQLQQNYIISQTDSEIIITDQHAAHERLVYEDMKEALKVDGVKKQLLLTPVFFESTEDKIEKLLNYKNELGKLGIGIQYSSPISILISEIPMILGQADPEQLIKDISDELVEYGTEISASSIIEHITETIACHYSIRSGRTLSITEMNAILRKMETTQNSAQCNHGRPTYITLKLSDIEHLFGRS